MDPGDSWIHFAFCPLLLVATLVASLTKQLAVLLLGHTLAALLDNGTHRISSLYSYPAEPFDSVATREYVYRYNRSGTHFRHRNTLRFGALPT